MRSSFVLISILCISALAGCARHSDREWVLREFNVPQEVELTVNSTPEDDSNWAGRKNLSLNATFKFTPTQLMSYEESIERHSEDWHPLPFSNELRDQLITRLDSQKTTGAIRKAAHGFYSLKSANGKNLLKSSKRVEWTSLNPDIELAILNADSAEMKVFVRQQ